MPRSVTPKQLVQLLYHFALLTHVQKVANSIRTSRGRLIDRNVVGAVFYVIRVWLLAFQCSVWQPLCVQPGLALVVDEMYLTATKVAAGRFLGKKTGNQQLCIFGGCEIDIQSRKCTGKGFARIVPNVSGPIVKKILDSQVHKCAGNHVEIWSDEGAAYDWMDNERNGYKRRSVCHTAGQFADEAGRGNNAQEAVHSRLRGFFKKTGVKMPRKGDHAALFAEFWWRAANVSEAGGLPKRHWELASFWRLCATLLRVVSRETMQNLASRGASVLGRWGPSEELAQSFQEMIPTLQESGKKACVGPSEVYSAVPSEKDLDEVHVAALSPIEQGRDVMHRWCFDIDDQPTRHAGRPRQRRIWKGARPRVPRGWLRKMDSNRGGRRVSLKSKAGSRPGPLQPLPSKHRLKRKTSVAELTQDDPAPRTGAEAAAIQAVGNFHRGQIRPARKVKKQMAADDTDDSQWPGTKAALAASLEMQEQLMEQYSQVNGLLEIMGLRREPVPPDGACQFAAVVKALDAQKVYTSLGVRCPRTKGALRKMVLEHMAATPDRYQPFVENNEPWDVFLKRMSLGSEWGEGVTLQGISDYLQIDIETVHPGETEYVMCPMAPDWSKLPAKGRIVIAWDGGRHFDAAGPNIEDEIESIPSEPDENDVELVSSQPKLSTPLRLKRQPQVNESRAEAGGAPGGGSPTVPQSPWPWRVGQVISCEYRSESSANELTTRILKVMGYCRLRHGQGVVVQPDGGGIRRYYISKMENVCLH